MYAGSAQLVRGMNAFVSLRLNSCKTARRPGSPQLRLLEQMLSCMREASIENPANGLTTFTLSGGDLTAIDYPDTAAGDCVRYGLLC